MIRNLQQDPYSRAAGLWVANVNVTEDADSRRVYSCADTTKTWAFSVLQQTGSDRYGKTLVAVIELGQPVDLAGTTLLKMSCADDWTCCRISDTRYWVSGRLNNLGSLWHELQIKPELDTTVKLLGSALYTPEDWTLVRELVSTGVLQIPWFAVPKTAPGDDEPQPVLMP